MVMASNESKPSSLVDFNIKFWDESIYHIKRFDKIMCNEYKQLQQQILTFDMINGTISMCFGLILVGDGFECGEVFRILISQNSIEQLES